MSIQRYKNDSQIGNSKLGSARAIKRIRLAIRRGEIGLRTHIVKEDERLDIIAGRIFGDGRLWWVLAICSGIGWALQVPPGTRLRIPTNLQQIRSLA